MANFYNPYGYMPGIYGGMQPQYQPIQQSYTAPQMIEPMKWVEGEIGAKAFQAPPGWPLDKPIPLWDSTDTVIYVKSWNPSGVPNPMQKLRYKIEEPPMLPQGQSGTAGNEQNTHAETAMYATKEDLEQTKNEIVSLLKNQQNGNQNGTNNAANRGGNR